MKVRQNPPLPGIYQDFRAVILGHPENASAQLLEAAKETEVRVVAFMVAGSPAGLHDGVLFIPGLLMGGQAMEIYSRATANQSMEKVAKQPREWRKVIARLKEYPPEVFGTATDALPELLARWDEAIARHPVTGIAVNDGLADPMLHKPPVNPYTVAFHNVSTHILAREFNEQQIRDSVREGHVYVSHDWLCDPSGFLFVAANALGVFDMGDRVPMAGQTVLEARLPVSAKVRIMHDGKQVFETTGSRINYTIREPGPYRLEAWLAADGEDRPWIYTNPIYAVRPSLDLISRAPAIAADRVEVSRDIPYAEGKPEDANKHKLDLYLPKGKQNFPVLMFVHGGYWRNGDRSQYAGFGNRFAAEGTGVVIPSYRLAPDNPHPAQIEDVASAFAWVHQFISRYGGDVNRIYIAGHSAGGHLVALLALDEKYLKKHGVPVSAIKGVAAISGVYDLRTVTQYDSSPDVRREASPIFHVHPATPPFLITYCQWDYSALPAQARDFDAALRKAFDSSRLVFVPGENHITEIADTWKENDPTAQAIRRFLESGH